MPTVILALIIIAYIVLSERNHRQDMSDIINLFQEGK